MDFGWLISGPDQYGGVLMLRYAECVSCRFGFGVGKSDEYGDRFTPLEFIKRAKHVEERLAGRVLRSYALDEEFPSSGQFPQLSKSRLDIRHGGRLPSPKLKQCSWRAKWSQQCAWRFD